MIDRDQLAVGVVMNSDERRVNRGAGHHSLVGLAEGAGGQGEGRDQPAEMDDLSEWNFGPASDLEIGKDGLVQAIVSLGIAENPVIHATVQGLQDFRAGGEVHVRHPKRVQLRPAVILDVARASARNRRVEVKAHAPGVASGGRQANDFQTGEPGKWPTSLPG